MKLTTSQVLSRAIGGAIVFALGSSVGLAQSAKPQYGGTLTVTTVYPTISPLSFDIAEWHWKQNHDTGMYLEQLFAQRGLGRFGALLRFTRLYPGGKPPQFC